LHRKKSQPTVHIYDIVALNHSIEVLNFDSVHSNLCSR